MQKFKCGDVVKYIGKASGWKYGEIHIVDESIRQGTDFEYSTNQGAWFEEGDFVLIREGDKDSLAQLDKDLAEELGEEL